MLLTYNECEILYMFNFYNDIIKLANEIEKEWYKYQYSSDEFYKIVWELSNKFDLSMLGDIKNQLQLLEHPSVRIQQHHSTFSDFHFQIFNNGRFLIEVLNWLGSHIDVHDHDFSGVQFQLKGNSLNVIYDFSCKKSYGAINFGELKIRKVNIWKEGSRSIVRNGSQDPHAVFHLSRPTTSLLIRTVPTPRYGSQLNYFPSLSAYYYVNNIIQRKKLTALGLLADNSTSDFRKSFTRCINEQSYSENFFTFLKLSSVILTTKYEDLIHEYAKRGENESKIIENVIYNHAIDFFKRKASVNPNSSEEERISLYSVAASYGIENFLKLENNLIEFDKNLDIKKYLKIFNSKQNEESKIKINKLLRLFNLNEYLYV